MNYLTAIPKIIQFAYPSFIWKGDTSERVLYLTFDDGPTPEITAWVLEQLTRYDAKATFFMIGRNVERYSSIAKNVLNAGHNIGNHTFNHLNGRQVSHRHYIENVEQGQKAIQNHLSVDAKLFRPPYGRMRYRQIREVKKHFNILMMDCISGDFDARLDGETCSQHVIRAASPGSIILFHDSKKAFPRLKKALPGILAHFKKEGYHFDAFPI